MIEDGECILKRVPIDPVYKSEDTKTTALRSNFIKNNSILGLAIIVEIILLGYCLILFIKNPTNISAINLGVCMVSLIVLTLSIATSINER